MVSGNPSEFLAEMPVIKGRLTRKKQTSLSAYRPHVYMGDIEAKMCNSKRCLRTQA